MCIRDRGYTYGGFMDLGAMPSTIDFQGPNGATFYRATQVSYTYKGLFKRTVTPLG